MKKHLALVAGTIMALSIHVVEAQQLPVPAPSPTLPAIVAPKQTAPSAPPEITPPAASASPSSSPKRTSAPTESPAPRSVGRPGGRKSTVDLLSPEAIDEAVRLLKERFVDPSAFGETEMKRATLQGLLDRLAPGASLLSGTGSGGREPGPFRGEILNDRIGYLRLGAITPAEIAEMDAKLLDFAGKEIKAVILDLRGAPSGGDFEVAADVMKRFVTKGKLLFKVTRPSAAEVKEFDATDDPKFQGLLVVLVDGNNAGATEAIAAVLRIHAKAMIVGQKTRVRPLSLRMQPYREDRCCVSRPPR